MAKPVKKFKQESHRPLPFSKINWILFCAGIMTLIVGYIFLSIGPWNSFWSLTLAPILLVLGYCVLIPVSILYKRKTSKETAVHP
jgi:uncharacterized membrane protein